MIPPVVAQSKTEPTAETNKQQTGDNTELPADSSKSNKSSKPSSSAPSTAQSSTSTSSSPKQPNTNVEQTERAQEVAYSEARPANFIFLVDVSGSMVLPRTMVKGADGSNITLFEALRSALKQIAADSRLLSSDSKVAFITFGTAINEKSDWPSSVKLETDRQLLLSKIQSPTELQADKHGDTYMAGALEEAYKKALSFSTESPPCTTNFILMLTDGWDEPPPGAPLQIRPTASKIVAKEKESKDKLGVNTWQVRVIGLQRLPEKKSGTTTAAEVANLLGGEFLDVTKAKGGTVAEQIYLSLKKTIGELEGQIDLPDLSSPGGIVDFGKVANSPRLASSVQMTNKSCYVEKITGVKEISGKSTSAEQAQVRKFVNAARSQGKFPHLPEDANGLRCTSTLPPGALKVLLRGAPEFLLAPVNRVEPNLVDSSTPYKQADIELVVGPQCPPGSYFGFMEFSSTAKVPGKIAYTVTVPSRYFVEPEVVAVEVKKQGFFLNQPSHTEMSFDLGARVNSSYSMDFVFDIQPESGRKKLRNGGSGAQFDWKLINEGRTINATVNTAAAKPVKVTLPVFIPPDTDPGIYDGQLKLTCKSDSVVSGPEKVAYRLTVQPSPWDEMSPIAIPVFVILLLVTGVGIVMLIIGNRDRI